MFAYMCFVRCVYGVYAIKQTKLVNIGEREREIDRWWRMNWGIVIFQGKVCTLI